MDYSNIIVAGLALAGTMVGSYWGQSKTTALVLYRLKELEDKVNKHNNLVERMAVVERDLKAVWRNIDELKGEDD